MTEVIPAVKLTPDEEKKLSSLEFIVEAGGMIWLMVSAAVIEIKANERYWQARGFINFKDYVESKFPFIGSRYADQLVRSGNAVRDLPDEVKNQFKSENSGRALAQIPASLRLKIAWKASAGGTKPVTAAAVKKLAPPQPPKKKSTPPPPPPKKIVAKKREPQAPKDETGIEIPKEILANWERKDEIRLFILEGKAWLKKLQSYQDDMMFAEVDFIDDAAKLQMIITDLGVAVPYAVCPKCNGKLPTPECLCKGRGLLSKFYWDTKIPQDTKNITGRK